MQVPTPVHDVWTADHQTTWYSHFKNDFDFTLKIISIFFKYGDVHPCPIGRIDDNFQGKSVTEYIGMFRPDSEDCAEIARKCEAGTFSNASIRLLEKKGQCGASGNVRAEMDAHEETHDSTEPHNRQEEQQQQPSQSQ